MSKSSNPNTKTNLTTEISINSLINKALEEKDTPPKPQRTPNLKRKTQGQLSEEKTKPPKIIHTTQNLISQQTNLSLSTMSHENSSRPKMLRQDPKNLSGIPCVSAHYTREAILTKDAIHPQPAPYEITYNDIKDKISDYILENKHKLFNILDRNLKELMTQALSDKDEVNKDFFNSDSEHMINLANTAFQVHSY